METTDLSAEDPPAVGDFAYDMRRDRYGVVMDRTPGHLFLRPAGGGREWQARTDDVRAARASETLSPVVAEANARSRERGTVR